MKKIDKLRRLWLSPEERTLLKAVERGQPKHKAVSRTFKISKKREGLQQRIRQATRDRSGGAEILLLDGKPLRECTPEVRKAFLIQCQIRSFYIWDADEDTILSEDGYVYDLIDKEGICPKCFRYIGDSNFCKYCGARVE